MLALWMVQKYLLFTCFLILLVTSSQCWNNKENNRKENIFSFKSSQISNHVIVRAIGRPLFKKHSKNNVDGIWDHSNVTILSRVHVSNLLLLIYSSLTHLEVSSALCNALIEAKQVLYFALRASFYASLLIVSSVNDKLELW